MKKLFIAAAVIVMAGSMASCGQKTQKAAQDTAATEPVATEQVEAVEIEAVTPESRFLPLQRVRKHNRSRQIISSNLEGYY